MRARSNRQRQLRVGQPPKFDRRPPCYVGKVVVGDEEQTLKAGHILFQKGFYVQSVIFPAVPYHGGVLRIQVNANHRPDSVKDLVNAFKELQKEIEFPNAGLKNAA